MCDSSVIFLHSRIADDGMGLHRIRAMQLYVDVE
jgi:hypothetical protein